MTRPICSVGRIGAVAWFDKAEGMTRESEGAAQMALFPLFTRLFVQLYTQVSLRIPAPRESWTS
jgi:hypothetical protein